MKGAVFFDRDGTLIEEVGYLDSLDKVQLYPEAYEAVRLLNAKDVLAIVITNQSGVARGFFDEDFVRKTHSFLAALLKQQGALINAFYFCPHHPSEAKGEYRQNCECRKPQAGMLRQAAADWQIELADSFVIGDSITDMQAADAAGARGILLATGYGKGIQNTGYPRFDNVLNATRWALTEMGL
jgi:D-glycero-D-manno-heptose 1,7-bisphosphate phosphatase